MSVGWKRRKRSTTDSRGVKSDRSGIVIPIFKGQSPVLLLANELLVKLTGWPFILIYFPYIP